ncbi:MAG: hypothetical protein WCH01_23165, partial [Methylococcaceae bacterium]
FCFGLFRVHYRTCSTYFWTGTKCYQITIEIKKVVKKKTNIKKRKQALTSDKKDGIILLSYEISEEPIFDKRYQSLLQAIQDELADIHEKIFHLQYKVSDRMISRLEELVKQNPQIPKISNYLACAYQLTNSNKLFACVEENYKKHPDYLFARVHYARQCMDNNELEKIPEIFKEGYELKLLYPHRNRFHISEFIAFNAIMCRYYDTIGDRQAAKVVLKALEEIAPEHPATKQVKRCMKETFLEKLLKKLKPFKSGKQPQQSSDENKPSRFKA